MNKTRSLRMLAAATALLLVAVLNAGCGAPAADPTTVVEQLYEAQNAGDVDAVMALYAEDALLRAEIGTWEGKDNIIRVVQSSVDAGEQAEISNVRVNGNAVCYSIRVTVNGNFSYDGDNFLTIVEDGKIVFDGQTGYAPEELLEGRNPDDPCAGA